jgi:hypothetical protein
MRRLCLAFFASMLFAAPAAAGGCCGYGAASYDIQPQVPVSTYRYDAPLPVGQVYVVNQGPVLSGPGIYAYTNHYIPSFVPTPYPYVTSHVGCGGCGGGWGGWGGCGGCGYRYSYGCCGAAGAYWPNTVAPARWYGGYLGYRGYHGWRGGYGYRGYRYRHVPLARNYVTPSNGY